MAVIASGNGFLRTLTDIEHPRDTSKLENTRLYGGYFYAFSNLSTEYLRASS